MNMELRRRAIDKMHKRRDRYEIPEWQRDEVWPPEKKRLLIDTILKGWHLPKFYFLKTSDTPEGWEVVDGQQRLATIFEFLDNKLTVAPETRDAFGGPYYKDLQPDLSDRFDDFELDFEEITDAAEGEVEEFFQRLQEGLPLSPAERLNAIPGNLTDFVRKLSKHNLFQSKVAIGDSRYAYFDICCKVAAVEIQGFAMRLRLPELQDLLQTNKTFSSNSNVAHRIVRTFDYLDSEVFPQRSPILRNRSIIQSFVTLTAKLTESGGMAGRAPRLRGFLEAFAGDLVREVEKGHAATDLDLLEFQSTISANILSGPETRHRILLKKLLLFDLSFIDVLGPQSVATSGIRNGLERTVESIQESVYLLNKAYQSSTGEDLFKPTNETTQAFVTIGRAAADIREYGQFIDALYFLLYEGSGGGKRLEPGVAEIVADIRELRTQMRHDVDHGGPSEIRAKRKKLAAVFEKYGGVSSPDLLRRENFPVVQLRLLTLVDEVLRELRGTITKS